MLVRFFLLSLFFFDNTALSATNFCAGKAANTYYCIDDTKMQHCTGNDWFVLKTCPAHLCVTRTPANRNPCVGKAAATREDGVVPPTMGNGEVIQPPSTPPTPPPGTGGDGTICTGGPKFDPAGTKNVGNQRGIQFIGGQCINGKDCASACCAGPCGICSGIGAQFQAGKTGCGFGG